MKSVLAGVAFGVLAACTTIGGNAGESSADASFRAIYEAEWDWRKTLDPEEDEESSDADAAPSAWSRVDPAGRRVRQV